MALTASAGAAAGCADLGAGCALQAAKGSSAAKTAARRKADFINIPHNSVQKVSIMPKNRISEQKRNLCPCQMPETLAHPKLDIRSARMQTPPACCLFFCIKKAPDYSGALDGGLAVTYFHTGIR
ncbi:MAG: hypothetical protein Q4A62_07560, partial [Eikenella sp.]|nr:hypothetical protein [Eikenella sp.]